MTCVTRNRCGNINTQIARRCRTAMSALASTLPNAYAPSGSHARGVVIARTGNSNK